MLGNVQNLVFVFLFVIFLGTVCVAEAVVLTYIRHQAAIRKFLWNLRFAVMSRVLASIYWSRALVIRAFDQFERRLMPGLHRQ